MPHTGRARLVLGDLKIVRDKLEDETGQVAWRLYWITAVVLVRAVGHVLVKVDGGETSHVREIANELHRNWKTAAAEHAIFRDFIELERNNILKEYEFAVSEGPVPIMVTLDDPISGDSPRLGALIEENIYRPMLSGPYEGEDGRTLLDEAIDWWTKQLDCIDRRVDRLLTTEAIKRKTAAPGKQST